MQRLAFFLLVAASFALSGCTFIGMGIGAAVTKTTPVATMVPDEEVPATTTTGERNEAPVAPVRTIVKRRHYAELGAGIGAIFDAAIIALLVGAALYAGGSGGGWPGGWSNSF